MVLAKQNVPVKLGPSIDTKTDSKQLQGNLLTLENATVEKTGEIKKRNGFTSLGTSILGTSNSITNAVKLANYNEELSLIDSRSLYTYSSATGVWSNKGVCPTTQSTTTNVVTNSYEQTNADLAYSNGVTTYAWEDSRGGVRVTVIDEASGARILTDSELAADGERPRVFAIGENHFVYYYDTVEEELRCVKISTISPSIGGTRNTIAILDPSYAHYDVCLLGTSRMCVAYRNLSSQLELATVLSTGAIGGLSNGVQSPTAITGEDPALALACFSGIRADAFDTVHVAWYNATDGVKSAAYYSNFEEYKAPVVVDSSTTSLVRNITGVAYINELTNLSLADLYWERDATLDINNLVETAKLTTPDNTYSASSVFQRSAGLMSKAYRADLSTHVLVSYSSAEAFQNTYFSLSDTTSLQAVGWGYNWGFNWGGNISLSSVIRAKSLSSVAGGHTNRTSQVPGVWNTASGVYSSAALRKTRLVAGNTSTFTLTGVNQVSFNHTSPNVGVPYQLGQNLHIPGGYLKMYDGDSVTEHNFHLYPESITLAANTSGSIANGTYQYVVVWEWIDAKGQIHRSAPSIPVSITLTSTNDGTTVTIPTLRYTAKTAPSRAEVVASVYRTTNGGTLFYKVSSDTSPLYNDTTVDTITFSDTLVDGDITDNPLLYTTGDVLENTAISACDVVVSFKNRLFAAGLEQNNYLSYSKEIVQDEGAAFSAALQISVAGGQGGVKALAILDDKLVIFKQNKIFILTGQGPTDTGSQNDFQAPQEIASDVGCAEPESVVLTPKGILFKSAKGIYLLDRSLQTPYIGDKVQDYNSLNISSAITVPDLNQVRFTTEEGTTLVYDWYYDAWSVYTNQEAVSATQWNDSYVIVNSSGVASEEVVNNYSDNGKPIKTKIETSWISTAGLQGYQRLYKLIILGSYLGNHNLKCSIAYDFKPFNQETFSINPASINGDVYGADATYGDSLVYGGGDGVYQFEVKPSIQKCQAFKLTIEDTFPESQGTAAFSISSVTAVVGIKTGTNRLPNSKTMT